MAWHQLLACRYNYVSNYLSKVKKIFRQACIRESHWGWPGRASEKRRAQGVFSLEFTIIVVFCDFKNLPNDIKIHLLYPLHPYRGSSLHHLFVWVETQQRGMELSVLLFNLSPELYPTMGKRLHIPKEKPAGGPHKVRSYCCYVCSLLQKALFFLKSASGAVAELTWACPKCRHESKDHPRKYVCYCGKVQDPPFDPWILPHSCGEVCKRKLSPKCGHQCLILCHPGPCPPCPKVSRNSQPSFIFSLYDVLRICQSPID